VRTLAAFVVALAVLLLDIPGAGASQADLERVQRRANQAAAALSAAQSRLSNIQARIADLEARRQAAEQQLEVLQVSVRNIAIDQFVRGRSRRVPSDVDASDVSATARARALASLVASGDTDAVDAYRAATEDLDAAVSALTVSRKDAAAAVATSRARAAAVNAELRRLQALERERIAREKARRAAAARSSARGRGVVLGSGNWICPVQGPHAFSNDFGAPRGGGRRRHQGNDIMAPRGTPAVAPVSGVASHHSNTLGGLAYYLHGDDGITYYGAHLDSYTSNVGHVAAGTVLGYVGNSGDARGGPPHLHFEMHPGGGGAVNPYPTLVKYC
jgi:murein DD-endopeptidase MepM/ murein hydrolase activator NlpD